MFDLFDFCIVLSILVFCGLLGVFGFALRVCCLLLISLRLCVVVDCGAGFCFVCCVVTVVPFAWWALFVCWLALALWVLV